MCLSTVVVVAPIVEIYPPPAINDDAELVFLKINPFCVPPMVSSIEAAYRFPVNPVGIE
jgi:hypothetical protein